jgi:hypothetical protein
MIGVEDIRASDTIAAIGTPAGVGARVISEGVAVVTLFVSGLSWNET